ncbi:MAG TPA: PrsW family glutamic-type intramembrane protease [Thermoanaerobaculia bacterium]|nr:PrsW family glutamic-type intramembrane protease [Thermoanaerobaculia bacterium]
MTAVASMWQTDRYRLIALAGTALAVLALLANLGFFFRAGTGDVLTGLVYNGFVLGWLLLLTAGSRTVSLPTLGIYWLLGVWAVTGLSYLLQQAMIGVSGVERTDAVVGVWYASITEEALKPLAVVLFFVLAARRQHRWPSISDGLLLGFVVGWGLKFHEDAHIGIVTGQGWGAVTPLSIFLPTIELWNDQVYNDHAVRGALEGLSIGAAAMLWHWRRTAAWIVGLAGPVIMFWGHVMWNYFVDHPGQAVGGEDAPFLFAALQVVLASGRLPLWVLLAGAVSAVMAESLILRWVGKRDRIFPPLPVGRVLSRLKGREARSRLAVLNAADGYWRLRRAVYFAAWRTRKAGGYPGFNESDAVALVSTADSFGLLEVPPVEESPATAPDVPADSLAPGAPSPPQR